MNWLNLRTEQLRSPEVAQASHEALATWLRVITYCCEQENGGRIIGAANWNDRAWMVACGVSALEVAGATPLLTREGHDIIVSMYPNDKQDLVIKNRKSASKGGSKKTQAKTQASRYNGTQGGRPKNPSENPTEGEGEVEIERNENANGNCGVRASAGFEEFWQAYPKKRQIHEASRAWIEMNCQPISQKIMDAVERQRASPGWKEDAGKWIPNPANWLRSGSWEDVLPETLPPVRHNGAYIAPGHL